MIVHQMFIGVRGKQDTYETLERALYGHSQIIAKVEGGDNEFVALICTQREDESSCRYNAMSQVERLRSFSAGWRLIGPYDRPEYINDDPDFYGVTHALERV